MLKINGNRLLVTFGGDVWELRETIKDWHLIRHGVTISMPKLIEETFAQFQERLKKLDKEREVKNGN